MGLVLLLMMFTSITILGLWEKKRSRKRFQEAVQKLRELEALTVTKAIKTLDGLPINYLSIHLLNSKDTLLEAKDVVDKFSYPIKLLGITVLTSFSEKNLKEVGINNSVNKQIDLLTNLAKDTGLDGIVCSSNEVQLVKKICRDLEVFVPGIRLKKKDDDQKRIATPLEAIKNGADFLVIGRPITIGNSLKNIKEIINSIS